MSLEGERILKLARDTIVAKSNIINLNMVTAEVEFDSSFSYPYTFTLMCGSKKKGPEGEGGFDVTVYAQDKGLVVKKL